jgi:hypothetical protein
LTFARKAAVVLLLGGTGIGGLAGAEDAHGQRIEPVGVEYMEGSSRLYTLEHAAPVPGEDLVAVGARVKSLRESGPWSSHLMLIEPGGGVRRDVDLSVSGCDGIGLIAPLAPGAVLVACNADGKSAPVFVIDEEQTRELIGPSDDGRLRIRDTARGEAEQILLVGDVGCEPALGAASANGISGSIKTFPELGAGAFTRVSRQADGSLIALVEQGTCDRDSRARGLSVVRISLSGEVAARVEIPGQAGDLVVVGSGVILLRDQGEVPDRRIDLVWLSRDLEILESRQVTEAKGLERFQIHGFRSGVVLVAGAELDDLALWLVAEGHEILPVEVGDGYIEALDRVTLVTGDDLLVSVASAPRIDESGAVIPSSVEIARFRITSPQEHIGRN